mmetsp:Transcript_9581/g.33975  ORF Transcript_9581/g.33975 Transcript_9581/m.33975 type:complete len:89 (-) Transcript_9581:274-540(-)
MGVPTQVSGPLASSMARAWPSQPRALRAAANGPTALSSGGSKQRRRRGSLLRRRDDMQTLEPRAVLEEAFVEAPAAVCASASAAEESP